LGLLARPKLATAAFWAGKWIGGHLGNRRRRDYTSKVESNLMFRRRSPVGISCYGKQALAEVIAALQRLPEMQRPCVNWLEKWSGLRDEEMKDGAD